MSSFRRKTKKDGSVTYTWRGKVPYRTSSGAIEWKCVERGTGAGTLAAARARADQIAREYHEQIHLPLADISDAPTFADAVIAYVKNGGERKFLARILERIGNMPVGEVGQSQDTVNDLVDVLMPGCKASTVNRRIFTPILAVCNFAAKIGMCHPPKLARPKGHAKVTPIDIPDDAWFNAVLPLLSEKMRAAVLLITLHGLRISEALERRPSDLNWERGELMIPDTKTGDPALVKLAPAVLDAIDDIPDWRGQNWLFGTRSPGNFYNSLTKACKKAGIRSYGSHAIGRHSFATRILRAGKSLKFLKEAGRWKTITMPAMRYGHLEVSEVNQAVNELAEEWAGSTARIAKRG